MPDPNYEAERITIENAILDHASFSAYTRDMKVNIFKQYLNLLIMSDERNEDKIKYEGKPCCF